MLDPAVLSVLPGCGEGGQPLAVVPLPDGGRDNRVLRLATPAGEFVLRERQGPPRPGADATKELIAHRAAAAAGLAPAVRAAAGDARWLLMDYVPGGAWHRELLLLPDRLYALARQLARLHALPAPAVPPLDAVLVLAGQDRLLHEAGAAPLGAGLFAEASALASELSAAGPVVLNHGDLQAANLVGPQPCLVDWEYAQVTPWGYDLACLLAYYPEAVSALPALLAGAGREDAAAREQLGLQRRLFALLDAAWRRVALLDSAAADRHNNGSFRPADRRASST